MANCLLLQARFCTERRTLDFRHRIGIERQRYCPYRLDQFCLETAQVGSLANGPRWQKKETLERYCYQRRKLQLKIVDVVGIQVPVPMPIPKPISRKRKYCNYREDPPLFRR
jgi:hypothetical protein